ncbi:MAG: CheF family chemotaxis protein [Halobacteriales archaeon]
MASGAVAQFSGSILGDIPHADGPTTSKITLDQDRLCVDSAQLPDDDGEIDDEWSIEIPLASVFDIVLGPPPQAIADHFTTETVTIAYDEDGRSVLHIGHPDESTLSRFGNILFMSILNETDIVFRHPAEIGGRVTGQSSAPGELYLRENTVQVLNPTGSFTIPSNAVIDFSTQQREFDDEALPCVSVSYLGDGTSILAEIAVDSQRKINLLGRFLRRKYRKLRRELSDFELSEDEIEVLTKLYTLGGQAKVRSLLSERSRQSIEKLAKLDGRGLVTVEDGLVTMSPEAWIIVTDEIEVVNT